MESYEERMQKLIEQDIPPFLALCSEKDRQFLLKRDSDRTTEEYVRLLYIGLAFKMRGVFFRILGEAEHRGHADEVISEFPETGKDLAKGRLCGGFGAFCRRAVRRAPRRFGEFRAV